MVMGKWFCFIVGMLVFSELRAQGDPILINGTVRDSSGKLLPGAVFVNKRTGEWKKAGKDGSYVFNMPHQDTVQVFVLGFEIKDITFKDSAYRQGYDYTIVLPEIIDELDEVEIIGVKTYSEIRKNINNLSVRQTDKYPDATIANPVSLLYEMFSKKEQSNRLAAYLEYQQKKESLLKDLFRLYNEYEIIDLDEFEFDNFIIYMNIPDDFLQTTADYDLAVYIKRQFKMYRQLGF